MPLDNITLNPAKRKSDQSLSEFQTGSAVAAHTVLNMEQLISCIRVALVDIVSPVPDSEGGVIPVLEVHELLTKVPDILNNVVSKWFGNSAHILAHVLKAASGQHCKVWAS